MAKNMDVVWNFYQGRKECSFCFVFTTFMLSSMAIIVQVFKCHLIFPLTFSPFPKQIGKWGKSTLRLWKPFFKKRHQHCPPSRPLLLKLLSKYGTLPSVRIELVIYSKGYCGNLSRSRIPNQQDLFSSLYYTVTALTSLSCLDCENQLLEIKIM